MRDHGLQIALPLTLCLAAWMAGIGPASAAEPLYQLDPYDQITLNKDNDDAVLKVRTLDLPDRQVPKQPDPQEKLKVRLLDQPDKEFEVQWKAIVKVELFEQMVLNEASQLVKAGKFDEAYDYFAFLQEKYAKMPGLEPALENYLFEEAKSLARPEKGQFDAALVRLREIHQLNPQRPGLSIALGFVTEKLCLKYQAADNYPAIRALLSDLAALEPQHPKVTAWQSRLKEQGAALAAEARKALDEGRLRDADRSGRKLVEVWPATPGVKELLAAITAKYPRVVVGVTEPAVVPAPEDTATRRERH
jgi:Flp pilus assembly protein TadD